jgi:hypothetical protein
MKFKKIVSLFSILTFVLLMTISCDSLEVYNAPGRGHGPPAHARAHGYRNKQVAGVELSYDSGLGLYVVIGRDNHYYTGGYFYRCQGAVWEISSDPNSGWRSISRESLPPGLQMKSKRHKNKVTLSAL